MLIKLKYITNWDELAREAKWTASALANLCDVSEDTLRRHFIEQKGKSPGAWLTEQRQEHALKLIRNGASVKEAALSAGYKQQTNFTRKFKRIYGFCPSRPTSKITLASALREND